MAVGAGGLLLVHYSLRLCAPAASHHPLDFLSPSPPSLHSHFCSATSHPACIIDRGVLTGDLTDALRLTLLINRNNDHWERERGRGSKRAEARETKNMLSPVFKFSSAHSVLGFEKYSLNITNCLLCPELHLYTLLTDKDTAPRPGWRFLIGCNSQRRQI